MKTLYSHSIFTEFQKNKNLIPCYMFHGLFGTGMNLLSVTKMIQDFVSPVLFDLPNHGKSPHVTPGNFLHTQKYITDSINHDLAERMLPDDSSYALLGHSLGAKYAMLHALHYPKQTSSLVVLDIAPMEYPPQNHIYIEIYKYVLAKKPSSRKQAIEYLSEKVKDQAILFFLAKNFYFKNDTLQLYINLDEIATHYDNLRSFPQNYNNTMYNGPTLFLRAETTSYFNDTSETYIQQYFSNYQIITIPDSTHILHIDNPTKVAEELQNFYKLVYACI